MGLLSEPKVSLLFVVKFFIHTQPNFQPRRIGCKLVSFDLAALCDTKLKKTDPEGFRSVSSLLLILDYGSEFVSTVVELLVEGTKYLRH